MNHSTTHHHHAARGLAQSFGLHPAVAVLTLTLDSMLWGAETVTLGMSLPISLGVSAALGVIAFRAQKAWFYDNDESAALKASILALLMVIPSSLPSLLYIPWGFVGFFRRSSPASSVDHPGVVNPTATDATNATRSNIPVSLPFYG